MASTVRKILVLALPSILLAGLASFALIEASVRFSWDDKRGTPGFYLSDPVRGQRLAAGYRGWFAGVPVRTNALGFRDDREYALEKQAGTFRILVLGDSVTFGHGTLQETTYPFLLEQRLKAWRPDVRWEVWNLGVPGYNTGQELEYLREVGERYRPDLVIVGFYPNDFTNNEVNAHPSVVRRALSAAQRTVQRRLYSYELYKRAFLTARWRLLTNADDRRRMEHLSGEQALLGRLDTVAQQEQQQLTDADYFDDQQVRAFVCPGESSQTDPTGAREMRAAIQDPSSSMAPWVAAVRGFQQLNREGKYRVMFFINMAPKTCAGDDRFYDAGSLDDDNLLLEVLGAGALVASSTRAFLHHRPSQMPAAAGHSFGNANKVKADVLFEFLSSRVLPPLLPVTIAS
ncbi:MAG: GDSL-type esterase/lipase family protein [Acidobacteriota bacterium]|nr:GDSL-type esterase/lipase family protein [Acidobacteriota bacterium]